MQTLVLSGHFGAGVPEAAAAHVCLHLGLET